MVQFFVFGDNSFLKYMWDSSFKHGTVYIPN